MIFSKYSRDNNDVLKVCAPMVRYSKLPFRSLVRKYNCDLCFTPMIVASSFIQSEKARVMDFTTNADDRPLVAQFAASNAVELAQAAELVFPHVSGIDLNCGCPQRWAIAEGFGCHLIKNPELVSEMVKTVRNRISSSDFDVSIKIRINDDNRETVELCRRAEAAGVSFISVHGRTPAERSQPVHREVFQLVASSVSLPVIANGDVCSLEQGRELWRESGIAGVMAARSLLDNPAMFAGYSTTPKQCIDDWIEISLSLGVPFKYFHAILIYMMNGTLHRSEKQIFNRLQSIPAVIDFISNTYPVGV